ncbi:MAG: PLP-dependent aminotransferase family protein [Kiloniellales bacterium]
MPVARNDAAACWAPEIDAAAGPLYLAIAEALASDIHAGRLSEGARLPPQRALAARLGIDFTTVSRAYAEAARRGLVEGRVGRGTFVCARRRAEVSSAASPPDGLVDLSMNLPPRFDEPDLAARMWRGLSGLEAEGGLDLLLRYQDPGGTRRDRAAGVRWLSPQLPSVPLERVLVCPGTQGALLAVAGLLTAPGETLCTEVLTYPGLRSLAAQLHLRLAAVPMDADGLIPEAFEAVCRDRKPKALYCTPTLQNPTTATLPLARREALVAIARRHGVAIIEDDAYGALPETPLPPLAALAPDLVYHVAGLAKSVAPALRIAYLAVPDARAAARVAGAIRATAGMASPLTAALATRWIEEGTAVAVLTAIRREARARQAIAAEVLPAEWLQADPQGFHAWLSLPAPWTRGEFAARLRSVGIGVVGSDAFALLEPPEAVRLALGAAPGRTELQRSLQVVADLLLQSPALSSLVV